jgi:SAM-dependent methyltransferase
LSVPEHIAANRANWNERADLHFDDVSGFYQLDALRTGANVLGPIESAKLPDLTGLRVAHFQSHIGTDTLSLKRLGADEVVGIDFSPHAIARARQLSAEAGVAARFVEGVVYDAPSLIGGGFDLVFSTWGTIVWMDDLDRWAGAVAACLKRGGLLYFADCHPFAWMLAADDKGGVALKYDYETPYGRPMEIANYYTYNFSPQRIQNSRTFEWSHSLSRILKALDGAGLAVESLNEHDAIPWEIFPHAVRGDDRLWRLPEGHAKVPLAMSITARKR